MRRQQDVKHPPAEGTQIKRPSCAAAGIAITFDARFGMETGPTPP